MFNIMMQGNLEEAWLNIQRSKPDASLTEWMSELYDHILNVWQSQVPILVHHMMW